MQNAVIERSHFPAYLAARFWREPRRQAAIADDDGRFLFSRSLRSGARAGRCAWRSRPL